MQIVAKMKVLMSPPGRILKEQPLTARVPRRPAPRDREPGPASHLITSPTHPPGATADQADKKGSGGPSARRPTLPTY